MTLDGMKAEAQYIVSQAQAEDLAADAMLKTAQAKSVDANIDFSEVDRHLEVLKVAAEKEESEEAREHEKALAQQQQSAQQPQGGGPTQE